MSPSVLPAATPSELFYPAEDGEPLAETPVHLQALVLLLQALQDMLAARLDIYIGANMFWYFEEFNLKARRAPDIMVIKGVGRAERRSFFSWLEGNAVPCFILELASAKTFGEDVTEKLAEYARLGVREYFLFDPEGRYLAVQLLGYRLDDEGAYQPLTADEQGRLHSVELSLSLQTEKKTIRVYDEVSGSMILSRAEQADEERRLTKAANQRATEEKRRADEERRQAEAANQRATEEKRRADEERRQAEAANQRAAEEKRRADELAHELANVKALLKLKIGGTDDDATNA